MSSRTAHTHTNNDSFLISENETIADCEDVYALKSQLASTGFSWTVFFACIMVGEVIGAMVLLVLCMVGIIDPETYVAAFPLLGGAILGAIPGVVLAR